VPILGFLLFLLACTLSTLSLQTTLRPAHAGGERHPLKRSILNTEHTAAVILSHAPSSTYISACILFRALV
jgi:hypothetical protein